MTAQEFSKAVRDFKIGISEENVPALFDYFDANRSGLIDYDEFYGALIGKMSQQRKDAVSQVFKSLDTNGNGQLEVSELKAGFNAKRHPDVVQNIRAEEDVYVEFLETFQAHH